MLTVACVLRTGGEYRRRHVRDLAANVALHLTVPYRFVCLSDVSGEGYESIPLRHDWRGWFAKIELWRSDLFDGPVLFLDLDTRVVGNIDDIATGHSFTVLENFWSPARIGSGLMAWDAGLVDLSSIYRRFLTNPALFCAEYTTKEKWGDQGFIASHAPIEPERWQKKHPGRVVSYRKHCRDGVPPAGASIVCYGGPVRPWNTILRGA